MDSLGIDSKIRVAVVMHNRAGKWILLKYSLCTTNEHIVYEARLNGMILATHMANKAKNLQKLTIVSNNQATIKTLESGMDKAQSYLIEVLRGACTWIEKKCRDATIEIKCVPWHMGVVRNEKVDMEAKKAAQKGSNPAKSLPCFLRQTLPICHTAARQQHLSNIKKQVVNDVKQSF